MPGLEAGMSMVVEALLWLVCSYVFLSLVEYVAHRWPMHSKKLAGRIPALWPTFERHAVLHHGRWYRTFDDEPDVAAKHINLTMSPVFNVVGLSPFWGLAYLVSPLGAAVMVGAIAAHAVIWSVIHTEMHQPGDRWFARLPLYRFLRDYHRGHHERPATNYNVVCPGADWVFGTYRRPEG